MDYKKCVILCKYIYHDQTILFLILSTCNLLYRNIWSSLCIKLKYHLFNAKNDFKNNC